MSTIITVTRPPAKITAVKATCDVCRDDYTNVRLTEVGRLEIEVATMEDGVLTKYQSYINQTDIPAFISRLQELTGCD